MLQKTHASLPYSRVVITSSWPVLNSSKPKCSCSVSTGAFGAGCIEDVEAAVACEMSFMLLEHVCGRGGAKGEGIGSNAPVSVLNFAVNDGTRSVSSIKNSSKKASSSLFCPGFEESISFLRRFVLFTVVCANVRLY